jgi:hypothetical protein
MSERLTSKNILRIALMAASIAILEPGCGTSGGSDGADTPHRSTTTSISATTEKPATSGSEREVVDVQLPFIENIRGIKEIDPNVKENQNKTFTFESDGTSKFTYHGVLHYLDGIIAENEAMGMVIFSLGDQFYETFIPYDTQTGAVLDQPGDVYKAKVGEQLQGALAYDDTVIDIKSLYGGPGTPYNLTITAEPLPPTEPTNPSSSLPPGAHPL